MIAIAMASDCPELAAGAAEIITRTTSEFSEILIVNEKIPDAEYGSDLHGARLDQALTMIAPRTEWLFTMDDDAAPLQRGWLSWLFAQMPRGGKWATFWLGPRGPHPLGTLWSVKWLRSHGISFRPKLPIDTGWDVAQGFPSAIGFAACQGHGGDFGTPEWWGDVALDDVGRPIWAHLGGGTLAYSADRITGWLTSVHQWLDREPD